MAWMVGIDEAGYGPNLGPFVMSQVTVAAPHAADLWKLLRQVVRRAAGKSDERLIIDDSKRVYTAGQGLEPLERTLRAFLWRDGTACSLKRHWERHCLTPFDEFVSEPWYEEGGCVPTTEMSDEWHGACERLHSACAAAGVRFHDFQSVVVFPRQFNTLVSQRDSKAAVPEWAITQLLRRLKLTATQESVSVHVDKLGGRNRYGPLLQDVFPKHMILCRCEGAQRSAYRACGHAGDIEIAFQPEADQDFLPVALASMLSKYVREVLMGMFNRFWREHLPDLAPTAGYPGDARRFYDQIQPARERLGIADAVLWRVR